MLKLGLATIILVLTCACSGEKLVKKDVPAESQPEKAASTPGCDESLWQHVYDPSRLEVVDRCKEVTGVIEELDQNEDGDTHMLLKLDTGQDDLLKKKNLKKKEGDLVVEVVCANAVTDKKARAACKDYSNTVFLPKVGDSVAVTGSFVLDSHNGWSEIHPASRIEERGR